MRNPRGTYGHLPELRSPSSRYAGIGLVGAIHIVAIWAIANGLNVHVSKFVPPELHLQVVPQTDQPKTQVLPPPKPTLAKPVVDNIVPQPVIELQTQAQPQQTIAATTQLAQQNTVPDSSALGLTNTHTTPAYPADARRLNEQGTVTLLLSVDATGAVTNAQVRISSGYPQLDQTAVNWVMTHWRYKAAILKGAPVASTTQAAVNFYLKDAH